MSEKHASHILDVFNDLILTQCERCLASAKEAQPEELVAWVTETFPVALHVEDVASFKGEPEKAAEVWARVVERAELEGSVDIRCC